MSAPDGYRDALVRIDRFHAPLKAIVRDGTHPRWKLGGARWNGWQIPLFDPAYLRTDEARASLAQLLGESGDDVRYSTGEDGLPVIETRWDDGWASDVATQTVEGVEYVDIGGMVWVWEEYRHSVDEEEDDDVL